MVRFGAPGNVPVPNTMRRPCSLAARLNKIVLVDGPVDRLDGFIFRGIVERGPPPAAIIALELVLAHPGLGNEEGVRRAVRHIADAGRGAAGIGVAGAVRLVAPTAAT